MNSPPNDDDDLGLFVKFPPYHSGGKPGPMEGLLNALKSQDFALSSLTNCFNVPANGRFIIVFHSDEFAPSHCVTMRNDWDGWTADTYGEFWFGKWIFALDPNLYPKDFQMKFVVDGIEMTSNPLGVTATANVACLYFDSDFTFPPMSQRFKHGIDNLQVSKSHQQRLLCPADVDESILYDVIIVGSGMGGGVLADHLSDNKIKTLVLEAGGIRYPTHIDNLPGHLFNFASAERDQVGHYLNKPGTASSFLFGTQMNLGGRSVYWEGLILRMGEWEAKHWPSIVRKYLFCDDGYEAAEKLVRKRRTLGPFQNAVVDQLRKDFSEFTVEDLPRSLHQPNLHLTRRVTSMSNALLRSTGVFSTADLLLDSLCADRATGKSFLTINLNHLVTHIETKAGLATEVVCMDLGGNVERRYRAKQIVLAAGSLESPRIALASKLEDKNGLIGVGLTDHPAFVMKQLAELKPDSPFAGPSNNAEVLMRHRGGDKHPFTIEVLINPCYWDLRHSDDDVLRTVLQSNVKSFVSIKFLFDSPLDDRNRVTYQGPNQKLEVIVHPNDNALPWKNELLELRNRMLDYLGATHDPNEEMDYHSNGTVHHAGGSLRMSEDGTGVVDENLCFIGYKNLYCCDVSVFAHIPTANPSLTLIALAQRLADRLSANR